MISTLWEVYDNLCAVMAVVGFATLPLVMATNPMIAYYKQKGQNNA